MIVFHNVEPELAERETRTITLIRSQSDVPEGTYGLDDDMAGPFLDPLNPQSQYADELLELVTGSVLRDPRYLERLERHYELVKQAASDPRHPTYNELRRKVMVGDGLSPQPGPIREWVARNAPCPCGSGKKYKHCSMWEDRWAT